MTATTTAPVIDPVDAEQNLAVARNVRIQYVRTAERATANVAAAEEHLRRCENHVGSIVAAEGPASVRTVAEAQLEPARQRLAAAKAVEKEARDALAYATRLLSQANADVARIGTAFGRWYKGTATAPYNPPRRGA